MYKILLIGTNRAVIDDFFRQMNDSFELLSCSLRYEDIMAHIKYVNPDAIIYCLKQESKENISKTVALKQNLKADLPIIIIGSETDCHTFTHTAINIADLCLVKPLNAHEIKQKITDYLTQNTTEPEAPASPNAEPEADSMTFIPFDDPKDAELASLLESVQALTNSLSSDTRKHILIVDDDSQMLKTIKRHLEDDYDTATAINGSLALRFLQKKHTDLVLLDYEMPDKKGPEVLEELRANESTKDIPVVFLTGIAERDKIQKVLSLKPQGYLLKPVNKDALLSKISEILG